MATRNRLYKLHYLLRKKGNEVNVKDRTVYRRAKLLPAIEEKWMKELIENGYMVGNNLFAPPFPIITLKLNRNGNTWNDNSKSI